MGDEAEQQKQKRGAEGKEEGGREAQTDRLVSVNGGRVVNRREKGITHAGEATVGPRSTWGRRESGRARAEKRAPSSEISTADHTRTQQCAVSAPVASVNQLQGPHGLSLVWDRKPLAKLWYLPRLEAGSTDTDEGTGHHNLRTVGPPEIRETEAAECRAQRADPTPLSCRQSAVAVL